MVIKRKKISSVGSCNFCDRGKLSPSGYNLIYPYDEVYEIEGTAIKVRVCDNCLEQLKDFQEKFDANKIADILALN